MALAVSSGSDAVKRAKAWIGTPYCWGGGHGGPVRVGTCVDCSGLVNQVYGTTGTTFTQVNMGAPVASIANAQPGDLVFFGAIVPNEPYHVGIYVGGGQMIDAPHTGTKVRQESIAGFGPVNAIRRLVGSNGSGNVTPTSTTTGVNFTYAQLEGIWIQAGGNAQAAPMAAAIAMAESGGNSQATDNDSNGSTDRGLWQINSVHGAQSTYDVMGNARAAVAISNNGTNWSPWVTYQNGSYAKYLQSGVAPDTSVPINATNAAANQGTTTVSGVCGKGGSLWSALGDAADCMTQPWNCIGDAGNEISNEVCSTAGKAIIMIIGMVLNPLIEITAGALGMAAGGGLMIAGIYLAIQGSDVGRKTVGAGLTGAGLATGDPGLIAAGRGAAGGGLGIAQSVAAQRAGEQRRGQVTERETYRQQQMTEREDIKQRAYAYRQEQSAAQKAALQKARMAAQARRATATQKRTASRQLAREQAITERQTQRHRQQMARTRQRARLRKP